MNEVDEPIPFAVDLDAAEQDENLGKFSFERRLRAAAKIQSAGYPVRVRLDRIVPVEGWREEYSETIRRILETLTPERITIGTLRFEPGFRKPQIQPKEGPTGTTPAIDPAATRRATSAVGLLTSGSSSR